MTNPANPQPLSGNEMPRFGGIATFMRLPGNTNPADLDVAVVGVPFDIGTSNRPGARFGPRGIRGESVLLRPYNMATRAATVGHGQVTPGMSPIDRELHHLSAHRSPLCWWPPSDPHPRALAKAISR